MRLKGMNEKVIIAHRNESNIESQINLTKSEILNANSDFIKLETDNKVKKFKMNLNKLMYLKIIRLNQSKKELKERKE